MSQGPGVLVDRSILEGRPIRAISYLEPMDTWDSGFCLFAGEPDEAFDSGLVCLDCLLDEHPQIGRGLGLAREHGEAIRDGDDWVAT